MADRDRHARTGGMPNSGSGSARRPPGRGVWRPDRGQPGIGSIAAARRSASPPGRRPRIHRSSRRSRRARRFGAPGPGCQPANRGDLRNGRGRKDGAGRAVGAPARGQVPGRATLRQPARIRPAAPAACLRGAGDDARRAWASRHRRSRPRSRSGPRRIVRRWPVDGYLSFSTTRGRAINYGTCCPARLAAWCW